MLDHDYLLVALTIASFVVYLLRHRIIVGVKYCFRYNARNRARQQDENGEPIDLAAMPQHRRRRREKKLMTMDEVNSRFPITKYKTWVSTRAAAGLSTEGGVSQSRAASIKEAEGVIAPIDTTDASASKKSAEITSTEIAGPLETPKAEASAPAPPSTAQTAEASTYSTATSALADVKRTTSQAETADEEDDADAIPPAVPGASEMLTAPGDTCAICIDTLEDDDDVRGLSCGHAFHASCLDPWLTSRRACCPLCKADYYVPKPRPEGAPADPLAPGAPADGSAPNALNSTTGEPVRPAAAAVPAGRFGRFMPRLTGRVDPPPPVRQTQQVNGNDEQAATSFASRFRRSGPRNDTATEPAEQSSRRNWMPWRRNEQTEAPATPSQLEAGNTARDS